MRSGGIIARRIAGTTLSVTRAARLAARRVRVEPRAAPIESAPMKIAVCVKQVPDATVHKRIDPPTKRLDRSGEAALNPTDLNAVEEALRIKEAQGGEVVLVSLGPEKAVDSLRKALAMGADRAVLVSDEAAAGSDLLGTSRALAGALEREAADLVLFGQASSDGDGAVLWAAVADRLRRPVDLAGRRRSPSKAARSRASARPSTATTRSPRRCPRSSRSRTRSTSRATPRSRGSWARRRSRRRRCRSPTSASTPASAGEAAAKTTVLELGPPPSRGDQVKIEDDGTAAQKILDLVVERRLL